MGSTPASYPTDKAREEACSPIWTEQVWPRVFPELQSIKTYPSGHELQEAGIDRSILAGFGRIHVEEKNDWHTTGNMVLEVLHHDKGEDWYNAQIVGSPGWAERDLACDYFGYLFIGYNGAIIWPWHVLKDAYDKNKSLWEERYGLHPVDNVSYHGHEYTTWIIPVPIQEVLREAPSYARVKNIAISQEIKELVVEDGKKPVDIECSQVRETEKAILVAQGPQEIWLPKSQIMAETPTGLTIPIWLAEKNGLDYMP